MNLSADISNACTNITPGISGVWVTARNQIASYEHNADGTISALTLVTGGTFYRIGHIDETAKAAYTSLTNGRGRVTGYSVDLTVFNEGDSATKSARMRELKDDSACGIVAFVRDKDGVETLYGIGDRPNVQTTETVTFSPDEPGKLVLGTDNHDSGDALDSDKQTEIHLMAKVAQRPRHWSGATDPTGVDAT